MSSKVAFSFANSNQMNVEIKTGIVGIVHTTKFAYIATKKSELYRYELPKLKTSSSIDEGSRLSSVTSEQISRMRRIQCGAQFMLLFHADTKLYALPEGNFMKQGPQQLPIQEKIKLFTTFQDGNRFVVFDSQNISVYGFQGSSLTKIASKPHGMKNAIDIVTSATKIVLYDKKDAIIFDGGLTPLAKNPLPKQFKVLTAIYGTDSFAAILNDNSIFYFGDKVEKTDNIVFNEELINLAIKPPYAYGISSRNIHFVSTATSKINESLALSKKDRKTSYIDILDDYGVIVSIDNLLFVLKFNGMNHIDNLKQQRQYEDAIYLCQRINSSAFNSKDIISDLYSSHAQELIKDGKYSQAFEVFRKSSKHPFTIIRYYKKLIDTKNGVSFKDIAREDVTKQIELLEDIKALLERYDNGSSNSSTTLEIGEAFKAYYKAADVKGKVPTVMSEPIRDDMFKLVNGLLNEAKDVKSYQLDILFDQSQSITNDQAIPELQKYIKLLLRRERQPTRIKIYNTLLIQCYAIQMPINLPQFIEEKNPMYFKVANKVLLFTNAIEAFLLLCEQYHEHKTATQYLQENGNIDQLINYISSSSDCLNLGKDSLENVYEFVKKRFEKPRNEKQNDADTKAIETRIAQKTVSIFFSPKLKFDEVDEVLSYIETLSSLPERVKKTMEVKFLEYSIFELKVIRATVHQKLIDLYLEILSPDLKYRVESDTRHYTSISEEKDESIREVRTGLVKLLDMSDSYQTNEVLSKIPNQLLEEKLAVFRKANTFNSCIDLVVSPRVNFEVALEFCDRVYDKNDYTKKDIYNVLFFQMLKIMNTNEDYVLKNILILLNTRADKLNLENSTIIDSIPKKIVLNTLQEFASKATLERVNRLRFLRLQNALLVKTLEQKKSQLSYLKGGKVIVKKNLNCIICGKSVAKTYFVVRPDNSVVHSACLNDQ